MPALPKLRTVSFDFFFMIHSFDYGFVFGAQWFSCVFMIIGSLFFSHLLNYRVMIYSDQFRYILNLYYIYSGPELLLPCYS
jgi:hypothetical protein